MAAGKQTSRDTGAPDPMTIVGLLSPLTLDRFLADYWTKAPLHLRGQAGRFSPILTWADLARHLETVVPDPQRIRVMRCGKRMADALFLTPAKSIDAGALSALLGHGATIVIDLFDEAHRGVGDLADAVARDLAVRTWVNVYASWGNENGLKLHSDSHDVLILQTAGRKRWTVYAPTRVDPHEGDPFEAPPADALPAWTGILDDGDLLYIPRGWPHIAVAVGEPSLHLTIGLKQPNGSEYLRWMADRLDDEPHVRAAVPRPEAGGEIDAWLAATGELIKQQLSVESIAAFRRHEAAKENARPRLSLPDFARSAPNDWSPGTMFRLASTRRLEVRDNGDGTMVIAAAGRQLPCPASIADALMALSSNQGIPLASLEDGAEAKAHPDLKRTLAVMMQLGLLFCEPPAEQPDP